MSGSCEKCWCHVCLCNFESTSQQPDWKSRALAAEAERDALKAKAEAERLREALKQARDWFMEHYSDLFEKRDLEGAARNYDRAHFCENNRNPKVKP